MSYNVEFSTQGAGQILVEDADGNEYTIENSKTITFDENEEVSIKAISEEHSTFKGWSGEIDNTFQFADAAGEGGHYWRGYVFSVAEEVKIAEILCGAKTDDLPFYWGIYEVNEDEWDPEDPWFSWTYETLPEGSLIEYGEAPTERRGRASETDDVDLDITLEPNKYYLLAQGREAGFGSGYHYDIENINVQSFVEESNVIDYWAPDPNEDYWQDINPHNSFRFSTGGGASVIMGETLSPGPEPTHYEVGPDMALRFDDIGIDVHDMYEEETTVTINGDGELIGLFESETFVLNIEAVEKGNAEGSIEVTQISGSDENIIAILNAGDSQSVQFEAGSDLKFESSSEDGTIFQEWKGDIESQEKEHLEENVYSSLSVDGVFAEEVELEIIINDNNKGNVDVKYNNSSHTVTSDRETFQMPAGTLVSLEARPDEHAKFDEWRRDISSYRIEVETNVVSDRQIECMFSAREALLDIDIEGSQGGGLESHSPGNTYNYEFGEKVDIKAGSSDYSWEFVSWQGDQQYIDDHTSRETFVTMDNENIEIRAVYEIIYYDLKIETVGEGIVEPFYDDSQRFEKGTTVRLTPEPAENWKFTKWTGTHSEDIIAGNRIYMDDNKTINAVFERIKEYITLTVNYKGEGTVTPEEEQIKVNTIQTIKAEPNPGYTFVEWQDPQNALVSTRSRITDVIVEDEDIEVTAIFEETPIILNVSVIGPGETNPTVGRHEFESIDDIELEAIPYEGSEFLGWDGPVENPDDKETTIDEEQL